MAERVNKVEVEEGELTFSNLNVSRDTLDYLQALSPEKLLEQLRQIKQPTQIIAIYAVGSTHYMWVRVLGKIKKVRSK